MKDKFTEEDKVAVNNKVKEITDWINSNPNAEAS